MSAWWQRLGPGAFLALLVLVVFSGDAVAQSTGLCGGSVPCRCGDTVIEDYVMTEDLGPCPGYGLFLQSNVHLNCQGFRVMGPGEEVEAFGINLRDGVTGATVEGCEVSGFRRGIRLRGASGNTIVGNLVHHNGNFATRVGYGVDLARVPGTDTTPPVPSRNNTFVGNVVRDNADEAIHVGTGSTGNIFVDNVVVNNGREQIVLLSSEDQVLAGNTVGGTGSNSIHLKDSLRTRLERNAFRDRTALVTGDSRENVFLDNAFESATLHLRPLEDAPSRTPTANVVVGGRMTQSDPTDACLRLTRVRGNVMYDTDLSGCRLQVSAAGSPLDPSDNALVSVPVDPARVAVDEYSVLSVGWRLALRVQDVNGPPLPEARVEAVDAQGNLVLDVLTDAAGSIPSQVLYQYVRTGSTTTPRTPHSLTVSKTGYVAETRQLRATEDLNVVVALCPLDRGGSLADAFDRPDSSTLGPAWTEVQGDLVVSGGRLTTAPFATYSVAVVSGLSCPTQSVAADFVDLQSGGRRRFGFVLRFRDPQNYYLLYRQAGDSSRLRISKVVGGVETILADRAVKNPRLNQAFRLAARAEGATLTLYLDGTPRLVATDSTFAQGPLGVLLGSGVGSSTPRAAADNFAAAAGGS